jgi:PAS domain S-box-containing protein
MESQNDFFLRLQGIFESSIDAIITIDAIGTIEMVNLAVCKLFQYEQNELIGQNVRILMPSPDREQHDKYLTNYHETKKAKIIGIGREVTALRKDGSKFPCRLAVSEVILNDRIIFTGIIHDMTEIATAREKILDLNKNLSSKVTERTAQLEEAINKLLTSNVELENEITVRQEAEEKLKKSQQELQVALEKEKELGNLKSRFVSMASHEFRTPLATILSSSSLISRYETSEQQEQRLKHVNRIKDSVTNLTGILNDFLSLSKLDEGKIEINITEVNLENLTKTIHEELIGIIKSGQKIHFQFNKVDCIINSDSRVLKNILFNLISNAIKYSDEDIDCKFTISERDCTIQIIDKGIGIPDDDQKYLFDRFFRAANAVNIQGTGLGLNIVKRYTELLKGTISFESVLHEGSEFTVVLPKLV